MPVYNAERYVSLAVKSILDQSHRDYEFLIVDDGSSDGSLNILKQFASQDDRIRLISRPNTGLVGALNDGLSIAQGKYVARMDADDISHRDRFADQIEAMERDPSIVVLGTAWRTLLPNGKTGQLQNVYQSHERIEKCLLLGDARALIHPSVMMKRSAINQVGHYREFARNLYEELDLFLRMALIGKLSNLNKPLFLYRQHPQSAVARADHSSLRPAVERILTEAYEQRSIPFPPNWDEERKRFDPIAYSLQEGWKALKNKSRSKALLIGLTLMFHAGLRHDVRKFFLCALRGH
jgi:glycosyltransferase involved in cell wall biosynthesis